MRPPLITTPVHWIIQRCFAMYVKILFAPEVTIFVGLRPTCEEPEFCPVTESCGTSWGGFTYYCSESAPGADISCKINRCKQGYFSISFDCIPVV